MALNKLKSLIAYSACDISDALLKLKVPGAGFIADLVPYAPHGPGSPNLPSQPKVIAAASTVLFVPKNASPGDGSDFQGITESNIPTGAHFADLTKLDTMLVMAQPASQTCAVLGGILALRVKMCGAKGVIVGGRVRDLIELRSLDLPIWSLSTSTVGAAAEAKAWAIDVPITVRGIKVSPGDIVFGDPVEGVVVIPQDKLQDVIELLPRLTTADDKVKQDVQEGVTVRQAFARHRGGL